MNRFKYPDPNRHTHLSPINALLPQDDASVLVHFYCRLFNLYGFYSSSTTVWLCCGKLTGNQNEGTMCI